MITALSWITEARARAQQFLEPVGGQLRGKNGPIGPYRLGALQALNGSWQIFSRFENHANGRERNGRDGK